MATRRPWERGPLAPRIPPWQEYYEMTMLIPDLPPDATPEQKATRLLMENLPPRQRLLYEQRGAVRVFGQRSNIEYLLGRYGNFLMRDGVGELNPEDGLSHQLAASLCVRAGIPMPGADNILTLMLWIRHDERRFARIAVPSPYHFFGGCSVVDRFMGLRE